VLQILKTSNMDKIIYEKAHQLNVQIKGVTNSLENLKASTNVTFEDNASNRSILFTKSSSGTYGRIAEELRLLAVTRLIVYKTKLEKELKNL